MKTCKICHLSKALDFFHKEPKNKDGYLGTCKACRNSRRRKQLKTKHSFILNIYNAQIKRTKKKKLPKIGYTRTEFYDYLMQDNKFNRLFNAWTESAHNSNLTPSIDRLDDYKGYSFVNIRVVTWEENNKKGWRDRKNGVNNKVNIAVIQYDLNYKKVCEYHSIREAGRILNIHNAMISANCRGEIKQCQGFIFKHKK